MISQNGGMTFGPVASIALLAGVVFVVGWPIWAASNRRTRPAIAPIMPIPGLERNLAIGLGVLAAILAANRCATMPPVLIQATVAGAAGYWLGRMWNTRQI